MQRPNRPSMFTRLLPFPGHNGFASDHEGNAHKRPKSPAIDRCIGVVKHLQRRVMTFRPGRTCTLVDAHMSISPRFLRFSPRCRPTCSLLSSNGACCPDELPRTGIRKIRPLKRKAAPPTTSARPTVSITSFTQNVNLAVGQLLRNVGIALRLIPWLRVAWHRMVQRWHAFRTRAYRR